MDQTWIVDYPFLAYKDFTPENREICIINMTQDVPQKVIHLREWEFVAFVNHTQMAEKKLYGDKFNDEINCDIMFLVERLDKIRLMSYKCNPWLPPNEQISELDPTIL